MDCLHLLPNNAQAPSKSLEEKLKTFDSRAINEEFEKAMHAFDTSPADAIAASCNILESLFKLIIESEGLDKPHKQTIKDLWKTVQAKLNMNTSQEQNQDLKSIFSGLTSLIDGIGSLRTHSGSNHGAGPNQDAIEPHFARLAVHASHSLTLFVLEQWQMSIHDDTTSER